MFRIYDVRKKTWWGEVFPTREEAFDAVEALYEDKDEYSVAHYDEAEKRGLLNYYEYAIQEVVK